MAVSETAVNQGWGLLQLTPSHLSLETIFLDKLKEAQAATPELEVAQPADEATHA